MRVQRRRRDNEPRPLRPGSAYLGALSLLLITAVARFAHDTVWVVPAMGAGFALVVAGGLTGVGRAAWTDWLMQHGLAANRLHARVVGAGLVAVGATLIVFSIGVLLLGPPQD